MSILPSWLSRQERKASIRQLQRDNAAQPATMTAIHRAGWPPPIRGKDLVIGMYRSQKFLAQLYQQPGGAMRLSVNRTMVTADGERWLDGITWDELQQVKAECGFGDRWAVEIYPPDYDVVNVANIRHLFLLPDAPAFAWKRPVKLTEEATA